MTQTASKTRYRLEMQGFCGLSDAQIRKAGPWLRFSPAVCMTWGAVATLVQSPPAFWILSIFAVLGVFMPNHPFDAVYNHVIRHFTGGEKLPRYGTPRRFACAVASIWLVAAGFAFYAEMTVVGYLLGFSLVLTTSIPVLTDFCVPSYIFGKIFSRPSTIETAAQASD